MAYADVIRQFRYWKAHPPVGDLMTVVARFVGWNPESVSVARKMDMGPGYAAAARKRAKPGAV